MTIKTSDTLGRRAFHTLLFPNSAIRLSFVDLRWAQLYVSLVIFIFPFILIKCPATNSRKRYYIDKYVFLESVYNFSHILCIVILLFSCSFAIFIIFHWRGHLFVWLGRWFHTFSIHFGLSSAANFTPDYPRSIVDFELRILNDNWIHYYPVSIVVYRLFKLWLFKKYCPKTFDFHN